MQADGHLCEQRVASAGSLHAMLLCLPCVAAGCPHPVQHGLACRPDRRVMRADVRVLMPVWSCVTLLQLQAIMHWCRPFAYYA